MAGIRKAWAGLVILALLATIMVQAPEGQAQIRTVWGQVTGAHTTANLQDVYMIDTHTAYAVGGDGDDGVAYRLVWTGSSWQVSEVQRFGSWLRAVVAISDDNVWAVGDAGQIIHKVGSYWIGIPDVSPLANLTSLQMFGDGEEGWAAGILRSTSKGSSGNTLLLHYRNGQWLRDTSINTPGTITALHFTEGAGWAVSGGAVWRYSSGRWSRESLPAVCSNAQCTANLYAVRAIGSQEAWFAGSRQVIGSEKSRPQPYALHKIIGGWQRSLPEEGFVNWKVDSRYSYTIKGLTFSGNNFGLAVGIAQEDAARPLMLSYRNGKWSRDNLPVGRGELNKVSLRDDSHALAVGKDGLILSWGYGGPQPPAPPTPTFTPRPAATPTPILPPSADPVKRVVDPKQPDVLYFSAVGHTLRGLFGDYWYSYGGLAQFGYPITEEFIEVNATDGRPYVVQYFERARFELHSENRPPYHILLGLLGRTMTHGRETEAAFLKTDRQPVPGMLYFEATGHNIPVQFASYWQSHGGLPVYGYPISEAFQEVSPTDGKPYLVQYFERNRLEYHPELPEQFRVSLGLLGVQVLQERGWIR